VGGGRKRRERRHGDRRSREELPHAQTSKLAYCRQVSTGSGEVLGRTRSCAGNAT
jgi:hypothetical protein